LEVQEGFSHFKFEHIEDANAVYSRMDAIKVVVVQSAEDVIGLEAAAGRHWHWFANAGRVDDIITFAHR